MSADPRHSMSTEGLPQRPAAVDTDLYRALAAIVRWEDEESCHSGLPGHLLEAARAAMKKARMGR